MPNELAWEIIRAANTPGEKRYIMAPSYLTDAQLEQARQAWVKFGIDVYRCTMIPEPGETTTEQ